MNHQTTTPTKQALRQLQKQKQEQSKIPKELHEKMALDLLSIVNSLPEFINSQKIAAYCATESEINCWPIINQALALEKQCYLPVLDPHHTNTLLFLEYKKNDPLLPNRYGILEPLHANLAINPRELDLVLVPLIAFDNNANRLGRGAGFYDRSFAFLKESAYLENLTKTPCLIGLGFELQCLELIPTDTWDIELKGIVTEKRFIEHSLPGDYAT